MFIEYEEFITSSEVATHLSYLGIPVHTSEFKYNLDNNASAATLSTRPYSLDPLSLNNISYALVMFKSASKPKISKSSPSTKSNISVLELCTGKSVEIEVDNGTLAYKSIKL